MNQSGAIPLSVRVIALLEIFVKTPIVLLGAFSAFRHHSPELLLGLLIPSPIAPPVLALLCAGSVVLAVAVLLKKRWGLDGLVAYAAFGLINAPLVFFSRARHTYEALMAQRLVTDSRVPAETAMRVQRVISSSIYVLAFVVSAICLYFFLTRRKAFRAACGSRPEIAQ